MTINIIEDPKVLRKAILSETERSEKAGEYFQPLFVKVGDIIKFANNYKPEMLVSGTNDGYVFRYKGKLYSAIGTNRLITDKKGEKQFIYKLDKIASPIDAPDFYLALAYIDNNRPWIKERANKELSEYPTFEETYAHKEKEPQRVRP